MSDVSVKQDVVYGHGGGRELRCDVYAPAGSPAGAACVLLLHGGGWSAGNRGMMRDFGERLAGEGFACVAPEYRLTGESAWPAQIEDVQAAIRWCHSQAAELGIDPAKIAAMGFSAGGHLALLAAGMAGRATGNGQRATSGEAGAQAAGAGPGAAGAMNRAPTDGRPGTGGEALAAVIGVYAPVLFYTGETRPSGATPAKALLGEVATDELARDASPLTYVQPGYPPVFLMHGTGDKEVPPSASRVFYDALVRAGVPVEMHLYAGAAHGFARQPEFVDLIAAEAAHFLKRRLVATAASGVAASAGESPSPKSRRGPG